MGACESGLCVGKKSSAQQNRPNTIRAVITKPNYYDLDSSMDLYDDKLTAQSDLLAAKVDNKKA